jgi:hypothetical protein
VVNIEELNQVEDAAREREMSGISTSQSALNDNSSAQRTRSAPNTNAPVPACNGPTVAARHESTSSTRAAPTPSARWTQSWNRAACRRRGTWRSGVHGPRTKTSLRLASVASGDVSHATARLMESPCFVHSGPLLASCPHSSPRRSPQH